MHVAGYEYAKMKKCDLAVFSAVRTQFTEQNEENAPDIGDTMKADEFPGYVLRAIVHWSARSGSCGIARRGR